MTSNSFPTFGSARHLACIEVGGADAAAFLHAQLSQRIVGIAPGTAPLAAWSDARGRVRAVLRVVPGQGRFVLLTHAGRAAAVAAGLSRYVLRAKVSLRVADELEVWAVLGDSAAWLEARGVALPASAGAAATLDEAHWLRLAARLVHAAVPAGRGAELGAGLGRATHDEIELAEIRLGLPVLAPGLEDRYLPQMLNLDRLDGIAFDKGCFPGQEVIARTTNLGAVKRRVRRFLLESGAPPPPGAALVDTDGGPIGDVIRSAACTLGAEFLAVVRLEMLTHPILLADDTGARVTELPLPYA